MSKYILSLIVCVMSVNLFGQSENELVEILYKKGLVSSYEKKEFLNEKKEQEAYYKKKGIDKSSRENDEGNDLSKTYNQLYFLLNLKMYSTAGTRSLMIFRPSEVAIKKGEEGRVISDLLKYTEKLHTAGLVSAPIKDMLLPKIKQLALRSLYEVTAAAAEMAEKAWFLGPQKLEKFAKQLLSKELVTQSGYNEIMDKSAKGLFTTYDQLYPYIKNFVVIDLNKYKGGPEEYLEPVYRLTAASFPGLHFDSLNYTIAPNKKESDSGFVIIDMAVTLKQGERSYTYSSFYDAEYKNKIEDAFIKIPESYHTVFNKILADRLSPYRLHLVKINPGKIGILPLTKEQYSILIWWYDGMRTGGYLEMSHEKFTNKITQKRIQEIISILDSAGLLSHLNIKEKDSCIRAINEKEIIHAGDILSCFKNLVFEINDLEFGIADGQYKGLTERIATASRGQFNPVDIIDTYNFDRNKKFKYGFTLNGKRYERELYQDDDWLDTEFWTLIMAAISEQDKIGSFYPLSPTDGLKAIYLTKPQADLLQKAKLLDEEE